MLIPLTAHFDASGTDNAQKVFAIGGWIAEVDQWSRLRCDWKKMIEEAPFRDDVKKKDRIFHASDLEYRKGIYEGWRDDEKQTFQGRAYGIVEDYELFPFSAAIVKADFEALKIRFSELPHGHAGNYFMWTFHHVMAQVRKWLEAQHKDVNVHYIFERGQLGDGQVQDSLKRIADDAAERELFRMREWTFAGKELLPLQTADLWAYESYKQMVNRNLGMQTHPIRYPYRRLHRTEYERFQVYYDRDNLPALIAEYRELYEKSGRPRD